MKVIFQGGEGERNFESYDENISDLLVILKKKRKGLKLGWLSIKVLKYELNYFRHPKKADTERVTYNSTT